MDFVLYHWIQISLLSLNPDVFKKNFEDLILSLVFLNNPLKYNPQFFVIKDYCKICRIFYKTLIKLFIFLSKFLIELIGIIKIFNK